jgi:hypothetical protein
MRAPHLCDADQVSRKAILKEQHEKLKQELQRVNKRGSIAATITAA